MGRAADRFKFSMLGRKSEPRADRILEKQPGIHATDVDVRDEFPSQLKMVFLRIPFIVGEVVNVVVNPELGREVKAYGGQGQTAEELLFKEVS